MSEPTQTQVNVFTFLPQLRRFSEAYNLLFKAGSELCNVLPQGEIPGYPRGFPAFDEMMAHISNERDWVAEWETDATAARLNRLASLIPTKIVVGVVGRAEKEREVSVAWKEGGPSLLVWSEAKALSNLSPAFRDLFVEALASSNRTAFAE